MRRRVPLLLAVALSASLAIPQFAAATLSVLRPEPLASTTFQGHGGISTDGWQGWPSGTLQAEIPAGSTIVHAWLYSADLEWIAGSPTAAFEGQSVPLTAITGWSEYPALVQRADVTSIVADVVGSDGGVFDFDIEANSSYGYALAVVYANPDEPFRTIAILDGSVNPIQPDTATLTFDGPIDPTAEGFEATFAIGIFAGWQVESGDACSTGQTNNIDVNGSRMTSCAGNNDDSGYLTVGGVGDDTDNPPDPMGPGGTDDELYDLAPFIAPGDTSLTITSRNTSGDDWIFFEAISITARATVSGMGSPTISAIDDQAVGTGDTAGPMAFTVGDDATDAGELSVTAVSSDQAVVADEDLDLSGSGAERALTLTAGAAGTATVTLTVTDGSERQAFSSFVVTVGEPELPPDPTPTATDDAAETTEDTPLDGASVLVNDSDPNDLDLSAVLVDDVSHGELVLDVDGTFSYSPAANVHGTDTFTYRATNGTQQSAPATVTITIASASDTPTCDNGELSVDEDTAANGTFVCATVDDGITPWIGVSNPAPEHGTVSDVDHETGAFTYTPDANYHGTDTIWFAAAVDGVPDSEPAKIDVTVGDENDAPVAVADEVSIDQSATPSASLIDVVTNDTDADGDTLNLMGVGAPSHGTTSIASGVVSYIPDALFQGTDTFTYIVEDGHGGTDEGEVTVTVAADEAGPTSAAPVQAFVVPGAATRTTVAVRFSWPEATDETGVTGYDVQVSKDGGAYGSIATNLSSTTLTRSLAIGHVYRLRVRSTDGAGNAGVWVSGPQLAVRSWQTPSFTYHGKWSVVLSGTSAGTGYRYSTVKGATASITVIARNVAWVAPMNAKSGKAAVYVDGVYVKTVNLYSATGKGRQVVFAAAFETRGTHTITIRNLGTAGHSRVNLDALVVLR